MCVLMLIECCCLACTFQVDMAELLVYIKANLEVDEKEEEDPQLHMDTA